MENNSVVTRVERLLSRCEGLYQDMEDQGVATKRVEEILTKNADTLLLLTEGHQWMPESQGLVERFDDLADKLAAWHFSQIAN